MRTRLLAGILLFGLMFLAGCIIQEENERVERLHEDWGKLRIGMKVSEVNELIGSYGSLSLSMASIIAQSIREQHKEVIYNDVMKEDTDKEVTYVAFYRLTEYGTCTFAFGGLERWIYGPKRLPSGELISGGEWTYGSRSGEPHAWFWTGQTPPLPVVAAGEGVGAPATQPSGPPITAQVGEMTIIPLLGIGRVHFGDSREKILAVFGQPDDTQGPLLLYASKGFVLKADDRHGLISVFCAGKTGRWAAAVPIGVEIIAARDDFAGKTDQGISIGASLAGIVASYGNEAVVTESQGTITLEYAKLNTSFTLRGDKLIGLTLFAPGIPMGSLVFPVN